MHVQVRALGKRLKESVELGCAKVFRGLESILGADLAGCGHVRAELRATLRPRVDQGEVTTGGEKP